MWNFSDVKLKPRLIGLFLLSGIVPIFISGLGGYVMIRNVTLKETKDHLTTINHLKSYSIKNYFNELEKDADFLLNVVSKLRKKETIQLQLAQNLVYRELKRNFSGIEQNINLMENHEVLLKLYWDLKQYHEQLGLSSEAEFPANSKDYKDIIARYKKPMTELSKEMEGVDIYLMCRDHGHVMYSSHDKDAGTNLVTGPYKNQGLARLWRQVVKTEAMAVEDVSMYAPLGKPCLFAGAPLKDKDGRFVGVFAIRVPEDWFSIITDLAGYLGETEKGFLVGKSEDKVSLRSPLKMPDGTEKTMGQSCPELKATYVQNALNGQTGVDVFDGPSGKLVLAAYCPIKMAGLHWGLIIRKDLDNIMEGDDTSKEMAIFSTYVQKYGYGDLFLIHPNGQVFFSVRKGKEYGSNILTGEYKDTNLAQLIRKVKSTQNYGVVDFAPYAPKDGKPSAFVAKPFVHNEDMEYIIAMELSISAINEIMQIREGMGETGETYLVGPDFRMRSDSFLSSAHSIAASFAGTIEKNGVDTEAVRRALAGNAGVDIILDYRGLPVLSAYSPIKVGDVTWALLAEIDKQEVMKKLTELMIWLVGVAVVLAFGIAILAFRVGKRISDPLVQGVDFAQQISDGDLTATLDIRQKDETGILADALNQMVIKLREVLTVLSEMSVNVSASSEEMATIAVQMASSSEEMSSQSESVASAVEEISVSTSSVAASVEQSSMNVTNIASMTEEMAATAKEVSKTVQQSTTEVLEAFKETKEITNRIDSIAQSVKQMTASLDEVAQQTSIASDKSKNASQQTMDMAKRMDELVAASKKIDKIVQLIKDIADQTKMLALNATIEAASAGEAGKGFAVVAGEVKELARQSAEASDEISGQIEQIQVRTNDVVAAIEQVVSMMNEIAGINETIASATEKQNAMASGISREISDNARSVKAISVRANNSANRMNEVKSANAGITQTASDVAKHVNELSRGIQDVARAATELASGTREISKLVHGIRQAARETAAGASQVKVSSEEHAKMATSLANIVKKFKL